MTNDKQKRPALAVTLSILWLMLICWVAYGWHLGSIGLVDETEPLFAEASRQILVTGDWITPFFDGETRFDKPILIYWCQAIAYLLVGVNEWAVRLPSAIAATGLICLGFYTLQWHIAQEDSSAHPLRRWFTAGLGSAVMAFNPEMLIWGRTGVSDMLLTGCMASALLCFFLGYASQEARKWETHNSRVQGNKSDHSPLPNKWYLACYVLIAGAVLTKGPVGIVLPGLIIGSFIVYLGNWRKVLREMRLVVGMLIIFGLSAPWYALVIWRNGWDYINSFFGYHNLERFTEVVNGHAAPWYFYFVVVLLCFSPYSVYLPVAMARLKFWQRNYWRFQEPHKQLGLFAFFWFICVFGFFTIAVTKLPSYVLPLMSPSAILVALLWSQGEWGRVGGTSAGEKDKKSQQSPLHSNSSEHSPMQSLLATPLFWTGWVNVMFLSALAVAFFNVSRILGADPAAPNLRQILLQSGLPVLGGVIWLLCAVVLSVLLLRRFWRGLLVANLLAFVVFFVVVLTPALFLMDHERQLPLRELSAIAVQTQKPGEELVMIGFKKPSVVFYTHHPVIFFRKSQAAAQYLQDQIVKKAKPPSILFLGQPKKFPEMGLQPADYQNLGVKGAYQLIRVPFKELGVGKRS
jgi:4-amino-4-deoxy-L-arabinose transferase-like glycosyltransferase